MARVGRVRRGGRGYPDAGTGVRGRPVRQLVATGEKSSVEYRATAPGAIATYRAMSRTG